MSLRDDLIKYEGLRLKPYTDTKGKLTIGVGRNLKDVGISELEAMMMLANDMERVKKECANALPWLHSISADRQDVIFNMVFNMGLERFLGFKKMIKAITLGNFDAAANEMLASDWSAEVKSRAVELSLVMRQQP